MVNNIHPTASVAKNVQMGEHNVIGPGCVIEEGVVLGNGNNFWMNVYLGPGTTIGDENQVHMGAVVGHEPQDLAFSGGSTYTRIGNHNTIREYVTIHRGTQEGSTTAIGDHNFFMANSHVAHNCQVGSRVILVNVASLTGYCVIEDGVFISGMVGLHQFTHVGTGAMISALSAVNKDVPPYMLCGGRPAVIQGLNVVGMRRSGISPSVRSEIKLAYKLLYREGLSVSHALERIEQECSSTEVKHLVGFVQASERGICAGIGQSEEEESLLPKRA